MAAGASLVGLAGTGPPPLTSWTGRLFWAVLLALLAWRATAAATLAVSFDESYYHVWSLSPQMSYLDHPPLVAWAMAAAGQLFGDSVWTVRIWPLVAGTAFVLLGRSLAARLYGAEVGNRAGILLALVPAFVGAGLLMTPDTLLAPCWLAALLLCWEAMRCSGWRAWVLWSATGLCVGLGLLSKYNMILFFPGLALVWLLSPGERWRIFAGALLCGVVAVLVFSPVIVWNADHDWASFAFQSRHGLHTGKHSSVLRTFPEFVGGLLLVATPVVAGLALFCALRGPWRSDRRRMFLACFTVAILAMFAYSALKTRVQANWAMLAFASALILLAQDWRRLLAGWRRAAIISLVALDVIGASYLLLPHHLSLSLAGRPLDVSRMREFIVPPEVAAAVRGRMADSGAEVVGLASYQLYGMTSFYAPGLRDRMILLRDGPRRFPWMDPSRFAGRTALLVAIGDPGDWDPQGAFASVREAGTATIPYKGMRSIELRFAIGEGLEPRRLR